MNGRAREEVFSWNSHDCPSGIYLRQCRCGREDPSHRGQKPFDCATLQKGMGEGGETSALTRIQEI